MLIKKVQINKDKVEKERLKALKTNDMDSYVKMLSETKNSRLLELVKQTHEYLTQLGGKIKIQKMNIGIGKGQTVEQMTNDYEIKQELSMNESQKIYYELTHTIKITIKQQPDILDGGNLKP